MAGQQSEVSKILQKISDQVGRATIRRGRGNIVTDLSREELTIIQRWLVDRLQSDITGVAAISRREVDSQSIIFQLDGQRYPVPVHAFVSRDVSFIVNRIKDTHENAEKCAK